MAPRVASGAPSPASVSKRIISPSLRHLACRVPSVTVGRGARRDARNPRDLGVVASRWPQAGETCAGALEGAPGVPPAAVAGSDDTNNRGHVCANASSAAALAFVRNAPRGQSGFSEIACSYFGFQHAVS